MSNADLTVEKQRPAHLFKPGQSGNPAGRPKSARCRHSENFLAAFASDFEKHGAAVIAKVGQKKPDVWLRIAADLLPKQAELDVNISVMHDADSVLEAFRIASDLLGSDPAAGLRRLKRIAPKIIDHE